MYRKFQTIHCSRYDFFFPMYICILWFRSHCVCDDMLFDCLKKLDDTPAAQLMGSIYFNIVQVLVFTIIYTIRYDTIARYRIMNISINVIVLLYYIFRIRHLCLPLYKLDFNINCVIILFFPHFFCFVFHFSFRCRAFMRHPKEFSIVKPEKVSNTEF